MATPLRFQQLLHETPVDNAKILQEIRNWRSKQTSMVYLAGGPMEALRHTVQAKESIKGSAKAVLVTTFQRILETKAVHQAIETHVGEGRGNDDSVV